MVSVKHKVKLLMVITIVGILMISGCGKKEVDYDIDKNVNKENTTNAESQLAQFKGAEKWKDDWNVTDKNGTEKNVIINADILVPELDNMSVIEVERAATGEEFREQFLKSFFEGNDIYYHDEEHQTKAEIEKRIAKMEEDLNDPAWDEDGKSRIEEGLKEVRARLQNAPEDYIVAEEFESCDTYAGYKDDILYRAVLGANFVWAQSAEDEYIGPESLRDYEFVSTMEEYNESIENNVSNECKMSLEEAKTLAENFLNQVGRNNQICTDEKQLMWHGQNTDVGVNVTDESYVMYGYSFTYATGVDGITFSQFPDFNNFDIVWYIEGYEGEDYNGDKVTITITDKGIIEVQMNDPVTIHNISASVKLLPLNTIKDIIKNELKENGKKYNFQYESSFNHMQLMYMKMADDSKEGVFSYVPVWCLSRKMDDISYSHPVFVNAMDGNIIYLTDIEPE